MKQKTKNMLRGVGVSAGIAFAVIAADKAFGISDRLAAKMRQVAPGKATK